MSIKPIPDGFHTITPYLVVANAQELIDFAQQAFAAKEVFCMRMPNGIIMHAQIQIGNSMLMLADLREGLQPKTGSFYLYVEDTDKLYQSALKAGATSIMEPSNQFYGDRNAAVKDKFGNEWWIATHIEDVSEAEITKRAEQFRSKVST